MAAIHQQSEFERCPLCDFNFAAAPGAGGFGKKMLLKKSSKFVEDKYKGLGLPISLPAHGHCPACGFGLTEERATILMSKLIQNAS